jgi:hypothetical protein
MFNSPFQTDVLKWMLKCFGPAITVDATERNRRFLEASLELIQACGCTASEAHQLVDEVYDRPAGEPTKEVGGVMVMLAALCIAQGIEMDEAADAELKRVWTAIEQIRAKQASEPRHSHLPEKDKV